jgi:predicted HTH transcriptional regulator
MLGCKKRGEMMTTEELEQLLEGSGESQRLEFKQACLWDEKIFAKHILALSNVQDGGHIVIGIEDGTLLRQGLTDDQITSFNHEIMRDQLAKYADPHVNFNVNVVKDKNAKTFVVIQVFPFEEIPVISRINSEPAGMRAACIYYRNKNKRVESGPVSNSYDLRDIIKLATVKMMQRKMELGYRVEPGERQKYEEERKGL